MLVAVEIVYTFSQQSPDFRGCPVRLGKDLATELRWLPAGPTPKLMVQMIYGGLISKMYMVLETGSSAEELNIWRNFESKRFNRVDIPTKATEKITLNTVKPVIRSYDYLPAIMEGKKALERSMKTLNKLLNPESLYLV